MAAAAAQVAAQPAAAREAVGLAGGMTPGQPVYLQLEDGPLVRGYVRRLADESVAVRDRQEVATYRAGRRV